MKRKSIIIISAALFVCLLIVFIIIYNQGVNDTTIELEKLISSEYKDQYMISIMNEKDMGSFKVVVFKKDDNIGKCIFIKNLFGKYNISAIGSGTSRLYRVSIDDINKDKYLVLVGTNTVNITKAIISFTGTDTEGNQFEFVKEIEVPNENYFIITEKLSNEYQYEFLLSDSTEFYDADGNDITELLLTY